MGTIINEQKQQLESYKTKINELETKMEEKIEKQVEKAFEICKTGKIIVKITVLYEIFPPI